MGVKQTKDPIPLGRLEVVAEKASERTKRVDLPAGLNPTSEIRGRVRWDHDYPILKIGLMNGGQLIEDAAVRNADGSIGGIRFDITTEELSLGTPGVIGMPAQEGKPLRLNITNWLEVRLNQGKIRFDDLVHPDGDTVGVPSDEVMADRQRHHEWQRARLWVPEVIAQLYDRAEKVRTFIDEHASPELLRRADKILAEMARVKFEKKIARVEAAKEQLSEVLQKAADVRAQGPRLVMTAHGFRTHDTPLGSLVVVEGVGGARGPGGEISREDLAALIASLPPEQYAEIQRMTIARRREILGDDAYEAEGDDSLPEDDGEPTLPPGGGPKLPEETKLDGEGEGGDDGAEELASLVARYKELTGKEPGTDNPRVLKGLITRAEAK